MATSPAGISPSAHAAEASDSPPAGVRSFEELCEQYFDFVWKCARAFGATAQDVDDVVQEVFLVAQRRRADLTEESLTRSWIYGITRRVVASHRRRWRDRSKGDRTEVDALESSDRSPLAATENNVQLRLLSSLLERLDEKKREVFVLSEILEMSGPEIAEALGIPLNTAYSRLRAAHEEFEEGLRRHRQALERRGIR